MSLEALAEMECQVLVIVSCCAYNQVRAHCCIHTLSSRIFDATSGSAARVTRYVTDLHRVYSLQIRTCGDDVEYAGVGLLAGGVAGPAENRAVVGIADRLVGEHALGMPGRVLVAGLRDVSHLLGVVKGPVELVRRWIGLDSADYLCLLLSRHSIDALLVRQADRLVCKMIVKSLVSC